MSNAVVTSNRLIGVRTEQHECQRIKFLSLVSYVSVYALLSLYLCTFKLGDHPIIPQRGKSSGIPNQFSSSLFFIRMYSKYIEDMLLYSI